MLVLSRFEGEVVHIGDDVVVRVVRIERHPRGYRVRIGIDAPRAVRVDRGEVREAIQRETQEESERDAT